MKAITLHQPWASLIALKVKTIETRSWPAPAAMIGERIAIHAAARKPWTDRQDAGERASAMVNVVPRPLSMAMMAAGIEYPLLWSSRTPLGAVVASAVLTACVPMVEDDYGHVRPSLVIDDGLIWMTDKIMEGIEIEDQLPFGDFAPGRWAWVLDDIAPTTERCPICLGAGCAAPCAAEHAFHHSLHCYQEWCSCPTCDGKGSCEPIPAKGAQRVWNWTP